MYCQSGKNGFDVVLSQKGTYTDNRSYPQNSLKRVVEGRLVFVVYGSVVTVVPLGPDQSPGASYPAPETGFNEETGT